MTARFAATPPERALRTALLLLGGWLLWSLFAVNIDLDDGYATVANAQYFLGQSGFYAYIRGPLVGLVLAPVEWLATSLGFAALDVRPHHAFMALVHGGYLVACWRALRWTQPADWPAAIAWMAAIPTVVFFSFAPFINHDLFPGVLALWMVWLAHRFVLSPGLGLWSGLVLLGAGLALVKPQHALVWVAILLAHLMLVALDPRERPVSSRPLPVLLALLGAAATSGLLTWIAYALVISRDFADVPFWVRPWELILVHTRVYDAEGGNLAAFFQGLYLRNLPAYGLLAMLLVIPGAGLALVQGTPFMRRVALVWLLLLLALLLTPLKEVRYLAVLAPFNALLIADILRLAWNHRAALRVALLAVLALDFSLRIPEAVRIANPWYAHAVTDYFEPLPDGATFAGTLYMGLPQAFVAPDPQAFFGDRYHRITHFSIENLTALKRIPLERTRKLVAGEVPPAPAVAPGDFWVHANAFVARTAPFVAGNRAGLPQDFQQFLAVADWIELHRDGERFVVAGEHAAAPHLLLAPGRAFAGQGGFDVTQVREFLAIPEGDRVRVLGFRVLRLCTLQGCQRSWP